MSILLKNAQAITMNKANEVIKDCCIGIDGDRIVYMGSYRQGLEDAYSRVIDCKNRTVMPGFVNAHNHAAMTIFRNYADDMKLMEWLFQKIFPLEDKLTGETVYTATFLAIAEMLRSGTTTFSDMYFFMEEVAEAAGIAGMRAVLARGLHGEMPDDTDYRFCENLELYRKYNKSFDDRIRVMFGPHAIFTCTIPYIRMVYDKAKELGTSIHIHVAETKEEVRDCMAKHGVTPVRLLYDAGLLDSTVLLAHCVNLTEEDISMLAEKRVNVIHNPGSNMKLASGIAPVVKLLDKGVNVCLGTDGASSNNNLDMLEEIRMATYLQKVYMDDPTALPVDTVLSMATVYGAKALGLHDTGSLEAGKKADIIIINTDKPQYYPKYNIKSAIVYSGYSADVETVIVNGKVLMEKSVILTFDEEKVMYEAQKYAEMLTS
ncbi:MAG: amidohydrolase [Bacillota bacterium]